MRIFPTGFKRTFKDFLYTKINLTKIWLKIPYTQIQYKFLTLNNYKLLSQTKSESNIFILYQISLFL